MISSSTQSQIAATALSVGYALAIKENGVSQHLSKYHGMPETTYHGLDHFLHSLDRVEPQDLVKPFDSSLSQRFLRQHSGKSDAGIVGVLTPALMAS